MALILHIDTALDAASICLARGEQVLATAENARRQDHAAWLQPAIRALLDGEGLKPASLEAVAVTAGPGSYTGLRIGMATAKGLCYALNLPLITVSTLEVLAAAAWADAPPADLVCPMVDARRQEVFTAVYDRELREVMTPTAMVLSEPGFSELLDTHTVLFTGNGSPKFEAMTRSPRALFKSIHLQAALLVKFSHKRFHEKQFADLAYAEPLYIKEFYTTSPKTPFR
ncbi:MAG TPA: tRNA (adenosine(37)-N6)-threonylcarbamoyltransferase complex dimerization subunit type 1 TsaB [Chitinophagaceae bacterium]|nr:tRNA (adenosine(37)-N6)-threonylcarbamoyltransferase complex dimerization subunit type 1 TsaB [Chitinophagaceae bacterium]